VVLVIILIVRTIMTVIVARFQKKVAYLEHARAERHRVAMTMATRPHYAAYMLLSSAGCSFNRGKPKTRWCGRLKSGKPKKASRPTCNTPNETLRQQVRKEEEIHVGL
jgi:hypothetical protein